MICLLGNNITLFVAYQKINVISYSLCFLVCLSRVVGSIETSKNFRHHVRCCMALEIINLMVPKISDFNGYSLHYRLQKRGCVCCD